MAKVKIKPFFYLILRSDERGKLHFDVFDFVEEGGIKLKKISNDNGLLKHENKPKEIKEYVDTLIYDIAEAYSRMGRIVISYRGSTRDETSVKQAVNDYNNKYKDDESKPVLIFKELEGNFSIEDYLEKINHYVLGSAERIKESEKLIEQSQSIRFKGNVVTEFEGMMLERKCEPDYLVKMVDWYKKEDTKTAKESLIRNLIPTLVLHNDKEKHMFSQYLEAKSIGVEMPESLSSETPFTRIPEFLIEDSVEHSKFLEYVEKKEEELEEAVQIAIETRDKYQYYVNDCLIKRSECSRKLNSTTKDNIMKDVSSYIDDVFVDISKHYKKLSEKETTNFKYNTGDFIESSVLTSYCMVMFSKYSLKYNREVKPRVIGRISDIDNAVYNIISKHLKFNLSEEKGIDESDFMANYRFIDSSTKDSLVKILNLKVDEKKLYEAVKKHQLFGANSFGVDDASKGIGKGKETGYKITSLDTFSTGIRNYVYGSCNKGIAFNKINSLLLSRFDKYIEEVLPEIAAQISLEKDNEIIVSMDAAVEKSKEGVVEAEKLLSLVEFSLKEVSAIKSKFKSGGEK